MPLPAARPLSRIERTRRAAQAARARGHVPQPMPPQIQPTVIEARYASRLRSLVGGAIRRAYAPLLRALPDLLASARAERGDRADWRVDGTHSGQSASAAVRAAQREMAGDLRAPGVRKSVRDAAGDVGDHNRVQLGKQVKAVLGIDLAGDANLAPIVSGFVHENVKLITGIGPKLAADVEGAVLKAMTTGQLHEDLAAVLRDRFGIAENRAELIAVDQIGKLNGQVNAQRAMDLGVSRFTWRTVGDERVRGNPNGKYPRAVPSHYDRDGKVYEYASPPKGAKGEPELPGVPIRCRCSAEPVLEEVLGAPAAQEQPAAAPDVDEIEAEAERLRREVEAMMARSASPPLAPVIDLTPHLAARAPAPPLEPEPLRVPHEQRPDVQALATAPPLARPKNLGGGINDSYTVDLVQPDGTTIKAVWKPGKHARHERTFHNVPPEGEHLRESAASIVAEQLGVGDLVPATTTRKIGAKVGSVQAWSPGDAKPPASADVDAVQRMRAFDFVTGNGDRHNGNVLWSPDRKPILIDHGLTFPEGAPVRFKQPLGSFVGGAPSDALVERIRAIDEPALASTLHEAGMDIEAIRHTLYRVRLLKEDPSILESTGVPAIDLRRWEGAATRAHLRLSDTSRAAADAVVESATRKRR